MVTQNVTKAIKDLNSKSVLAVENKNNGKSERELNPLFLAWMYMLESVNIQEDTARNQAKNLQVNAQEQIAINNEEAAVNYIPINTKLSTSHLQTQVPKIQEENQEKQKQLSFESNFLIVLRQKAQVKETGVNTSVNDTEQTQQESAAILQLLVNISNQILR